MNIQVFIRFTWIQDIQIFYMPWHINVCENYIPGFMVEMKVEFTEAPTAEILGISVNAVKNRIYEGRKRMMSFIDEQIGRRDGLSIGHD